MTLRSFSLRLTLSVFIGCGAGGPPGARPGPAVEVDAASAMAPVEGRAGSGGRGGASVEASAGGTSGGTDAAAGGAPAVLGDSGTNAAAPDSAPPDARSSGDVGAGAVADAGGSDGARPSGGGLTGAAAGPAAPLAGYRWELPCRSSSARDTCEWDPALLKKATPDPAWRLKIEDVRTFGGQRDTVYDVTLRFRGVTEAKNFTGGSVRENHFQIGGTPIANDYNIYSIRVSDPPGTYTLNRHQRSTGHYVFVIDYTVTIQVRGGATVTLGTYDRNNQAIANPGGASGRRDPFVVPGVPPFPMPYHGQFIQMDVVAVAPSR
jgi:hypothetical protein